MSLDPQRGRGQNDGPPDLDEILRRMSGKIKQFFGGRPAAPSGPPQGGSAGLGGAAAVIGILAVVWVGSGFYVVDAGEQAVVLSFGRYTETTDAGPHWRAPWPIGSHEIVKLNDVRSVEVGFRGDAKSRIPGESLMLTQDQNIVDMQLEVQYNVKDARDFVFNNLAKQADARDIVSQTAETAIREIVGKNRVDFVLNEGRSQIAADATRLIQGLLDNYGTGIQVTRININDVQPPEQVQASFADAVKAGQDKVKQTNEGLAYANDVVPKAHGLAESLQLEAEGYKQSVIAKAQGDAARFQQVAAEYAHAPQVTRDRMYFDTMQQVLGNSSKVLVDQKSGSGNLLYLPLDKLIQMGSTGSQSSQQPAMTIAPDTGSTANDATHVRADRGDREGR